jgi:GAF domain-containing protein
VAKVCFLSNIETAADDNQLAQSIMAKKAQGLSKGGAKKKYNLGSGNLLSMSSVNHLGPEITFTIDEPSEAREDDYEDDNDLNLMSGLLKKYFEPGYQQKIDKLDKNSKTQTIKHLLEMFEKVDKLLSVTMYISLEVDLSRAIMYIQADAEELVQADTIKVYLLDTVTKELYIPLSQEERDKGIAFQVRHPAGVGIAGWCATHDELLNLKQATQSPLFDADVDFYSFDSGVAKSILCVPIRDLQGRILGVLEAINKIPGEDASDSFSEEDQNLLSILGRQSGLVISNAQIYETMIKTQKKVEVLLETTKMLGTTLDIDTLIMMIMEKAKELLQADRCTLFLADFEKKQLKAHIQGRDTVQEIRIHMNQGIAGYSFSRGGMSVFVNL